MFSAFYFYVSSSAFLENSLTLSDTLTLLTLWRSPLVPQWHFSLLYCYYIGMLSRFRLLGLALSSSLWSTFSWTSDMQFLPACVCVLPPHLSVPSSTRRIIFLHTVKQALHFSRATCWKIQSWYFSNSSENRIHEVIFTCRCLQACEACLYSMLFLLIMGPACMEKGSQRGDRNAARSHKHTSGLTWRRFRRWSSHVWVSCQLPSVIWRAARLKKQQTWSTEWKKISASTGCDFMPSELLKFYPLKHIFRWHSDGFNRGLFK